MFVLYEAPAGHALFKVVDSSALSCSVEDLARKLADPGALSGTLALHSFNRFQSTTEAVAGATALIEGKMSKELKGFLKKQLGEEGSKVVLGVQDPKLAGYIKKKMGVECVSDASVMELARAIRAQADELLAVQSGEQRKETEQVLSQLQLLDPNKSMLLGLSHSLSRYKLKFSPDKVDTMIVQAIGLLDELDKEINTYAMRLREWFGWHFPELAKIVLENVPYAKVVKKMKLRTQAASLDFSDIIAEEVEEEMKEAAVVSMGTEIAEEDVENICALADQVITLSEYRQTLFEYLKNRMAAIAPNLTVLVGELVGARLIAHAGNLMNLAKYPASTVQILGAEKALFRALKTKHATPKYGLIYHASLVGQAPPKFKGKISRVLASKCALCIRVDALGDEDTDVGVQGRAKVENRLRLLEGKAAFSVSKVGKGNAYQPAPYMPAPAASKAYNPASDFTNDKQHEANGKQAKKRKQPEASSSAEDDKKEEKPEEMQHSEEQQAKEKKEKKEKKDKKAKKEKKEKKEKKDNKEKADDEDSPEKKRKKSKEGKESSKKSKKSKH